MKIPFNRPFLTGKETRYIEEAVASGKISGDGMFTQKCHQFFEEKFNFGKALLTTSCTDALEMAALLINVQPGDEIIMPSYTFVSTANAFVLRGAKIIFADSSAENPNIDAHKIEALITPKTKAIVPVHYAGVACNMEEILDLSKHFKLFVIEDAAQAIDSYFNGKPLGGLGDLGAFSFHETKNVIAGEGGLLAINNPKFMQRSEIIREKGTNRSAFFRGEVDKYGWVDIGSSFLPSEVIAAFLFAQLENLEKIQKKRRQIWDRYQEGLQHLADKGIVRLPFIPDYASNNAHMFYLVFEKMEQRTKVINALKAKGILAVFHYLSLHKSKYFGSQYNGEELKWSDHYTECLLRLPMFYDLTTDEVDLIIDTINQTIDAKVLV